MAGEQLLPWIDSGDAEGNRNSMQNFEGDGIITSWDFNFAGGYISTADVKAYIYRTASGLTDAIDPVVLTGPNTIQVIPAVPAGDFLVVYRDTPKDMPLVDYTTGAVLDEANLDKSNKQAIFVAAEMSDRFDAINASSADAIARSFEALTIANAADDKADSALAASAAAVSTANAAQTAAAAAVATANDASDVANGIAGTADAAFAAASAAVDTANAAEATANGIAGTANTALTNSNTAISTANAAAADAQDALDTIDAAVANKISKDGSIDFTGHQKLLNSAPSDPLHAASKGYVDAVKAATLKAGNNYLDNTEFVWNLSPLSSLPAGTGTRWLAARWHHTSSGSTHAVEMLPFAMGQTDVPDNPRNYLHVTCASVAGAGNWCNLGQALETVTTLSGQTVTFSFWARADGTKPISVEFVQYFGNGGSPSAEVNGIGATKFTLSTTWTKYSLTVTLPSVAGKTMGTTLSGFLSAQIWLDAGSTFNTRTVSLGQQNIVFDIAHPKLEVGSEATPYVPRGFGEDLANIGRYWSKVRFFANAGPAANYTGHSMAHRVPMYPGNVNVQFTDDVGNFNRVTTNAAGNNQALTGGAIGSNDTSFTYDFLTASTGNWVAGFSYARCELVG